MLAMIGRLPTGARWMLYATVGVFVLTVVQEFDDTSQLTATTTSQAMLRWSVPIMLAGLGGMYSERAGVVNIGLEGMLVLGTWFGAWGAINYGAWWGLAIGVIGGALGGLLHAVATVTFGVDHIISGVAINVLAPAITRFLSAEIFVGYDGGSITQSPRVPTVGKFTFPFLAGGDMFGWLGIPTLSTPDILGWFTDKDWFLISDMTGLAKGLVYQVSYATLLALAIVPISAWVLWRTRFGLRLRICGEHPYGGETQGINIYLYKYYGVMMSGALAGLGGAFIASRELSGIYLEGQVNGRGFIGLAALIFGNWRPVGVMAGAMLFGYPFGLGLRDIDGSASHSLLLVGTIALFAIAVWAISRRNRVDAFLAGSLGTAAGIWYLASDTVPGWWITILPFVIVLVVLIFFSQRLRMPRANGQPYHKGET
jgi:simple sugar transport system permease protein